MRDLKKFEKDIQNILDKFQFAGETRRQIFSQIMEYASEQERYNAEQEAGNPQKGSQND
jgi:hypothetical protein|tara:strand:- start:3002 stop:3178 length:177 start_codon:yes stop_codon:yes gene_type:complete